MPARFDVSDSPPLRSLVDALDEIAARKALLGVARMFFEPQSGEAEGTDPTVLEAMTRDQLMALVRVQQLEGRVGRAGEQPHGA